MKKMKKILVILASMVLVLTILIAPVYAEGGGEAILSSTTVYSLQIPFIENEGQIKEECVKYYAQTFGGTVFITEEGELVYSLPKYEEEKAVEGWVLKESFVGASIADVKGEERATTQVSYFKGRDPRKWKSNIPTSNLVSLGEIYDGIELKLKAYGNNVEKLFFVEPGAEPERIGVKLSGAKALNVNEAGELEVITELGPVKFTKPFAYQMIGVEKETIEVAYVVHKGNTYGFKVGDYDKKKPLIIDPLLASTFIGGGASDYGYSIASDGGGNVYVTGWTYSSNYPITPGAYDQSYNRCDVYVSKFDNSLSSLLASTFIGGGSEDYCNFIALDGAGNVYVTGFTASSDYPITPGAYDESYNGYGDVFISKLDNSLSSLLASTFIGGGRGDNGYSIAIDGDGNVYVTGKTSHRSGYSEYPTTPGAYDESYNGGSWDVFVSKLDNNLSTLLASTFIGGSSDDIGHSITVDSAGNVYVTGKPGHNYPTTPGAYDESFNYKSDVFVSKLDSTLSALLASTFIGGSNVDLSSSIAIGGTGNVYVTGGTRSSDYPTTPGAYDESHNGGFWDVFISKLDISLSNLLASTFIGGVNDDYGRSITIDGTGNVYLTGETVSSDYPTTPGAYDESYNGNEDVFVSRLDATLNTLLASTFIGGVNDDYGRSIAIDGTGNVYVTGSTDSTAYPTTPGAYDESYNGEEDVFVSKLDSDLSGPSVCPAKNAVYQAAVTDPEGILNPLRELRDDYLKEEYVDRYYDYSTELTMVMTKDPDLAYEAARLLVKYSPMIGHHVTGIGKVKLITGRDVEEVVSFTDGLKRSVLEVRGEIGAKRSHEIIKFMDEFKEQVEASEGKTFSEALQSSIYYKGEPMPDLVITNIRLDGNKVKYTIKNQGEAATGGLFVNTLLVDGVPVSEDLINRLIQPSQSLEKTFILSGPLKISPNTTIVVCADFKNKVPESDEENNCLVLE